MHVVDWNRVGREDSAVRLYAGAGGSAPIQGRETCVGNV